MTGTMRRARRRHARGFTLVELMVSLCAGLIVALAVVGLSREASNVFQDETRVASAQMQLRSAMDRLRNDVARAAFMSTGNIYIDPTIQSASGVSAATNVANIPAAFYNANHMSLGSLAGVRLFVGGSATATPLSAVNGLSPDAIELGGYFSNVEALAYGGTAAGGGQAIASGDSNNSCGGQTVYLDVHSSPSLWRLIGLGTAPTTQLDQALNSVFEPVANTNFIVRITSAANTSLQTTQYAVTCAGTSNKSAAAWNNGAPAVYLDPRVTVTVNASTGLTGGNGTINPVQIVRWELQPSLIPDPMSGEAGVNGPKYDLTRQYLDATGTAAGSPEVVAEYAVDLKFAFTEETTSDTTGNYQGAAGSTQVVYSFEDSAGDNANLAADPTTIAPGTDGPQRIRSVRIRLVTRAPTPDRNAALAVSPSGADYVYHYCLLSTAAACAVVNPGPGTVFSRTRTVISEVSLLNQARLWYR
jgi:Tfp pilus assembly protein PilW